MRGEQRVVVGWMRRQLDRLHWKPERWAHEAGLAPTTVTRAMADNYNSVSSVTTLHALARAAGCPSILDFLEGQTNLDLAYPIITTALKELLPAVGSHLPDDTVAALAGAVAQVVAGMAEQGDGGGDTDTARVLAKAARVTLRAAP